MALSRRPTLHGLDVGLAAALTHRVQELVHLLEGQRVVQRLQRVDGGHHGAAFKACSRGGERPGRGEHGKTNKNTNRVAPPLPSLIE